MSLAAPRSLLASFAWVLGAILAVAGVVAFLALRDSSSGPPRARHVLTDDDKATLIQAARTLADYEDPAEVGPPDQVQAFRRLAERIEAGDVGVTWPDFRSSVRLRVRFAHIAVTSTTSDEDRRAQHQKTVENFAKFRAAIDAADLAEAQRTP